MPGDVATVGVHAAAGPGQRSGNVKITLRAFDANPNGAPLELAQKKQFDANRRASLELRVPIGEAPLAFTGAVASATRRDIVARELRPSDAFSVRRDSRIDLVGAALSIPRASPLTSPDP